MKSEKTSADSSHTVLMLWNSAVENLPYFMAAMVSFALILSLSSLDPDHAFSQLFAHHAGLPNATINKLCLAYSVIRVFYAWCYLNITTREASFLRSLAWWAGNIVCFTAFIKAGRAVNAGRW